MKIKTLLGKSNRVRLTLLVFVVTLLFATLVRVMPAQAAACSGSNVTFSRLSSNAFYVDSGFLYRYVGYSVTTSSSKSYSDLWVTIDSFSTTSGAVLSTDSAVEDGSYHVGALGTSSTAYVYFYVKASTNANNTNAQNYNLNLFNNKPSGSNLAECSSAQSTPTIESDAFSNANKITSVTYTAPYLGSSFTMTVTGDTGVIGAGKIFSYSPASDNTWNGDCLELRDTSIVLSGGNTGTYNHLLGLTSTQLTNTSTTHYVATYTFNAKCVTSTSTAVKPLNYITSGGSPRHTDNSSFASLPPISPAVNSLIMTNAASPAASTTGGTTTYSVDITNSGPSSASLDDIINTLPSSPANGSYVSSSATFDDDISGGASASSISDPSISSQILTWTRTFTIPSGKTGRLTFQATIPSTAGSYVNSVIGHSGTSQIDQTIDTANNSPATSTYGVGSINMAASTKTASDVNGGSLQPGDVIEYTITANNSGTSDATGVHISDTLDTNTNNLTGVVVGADATDCGSTYTNNSTSTVLDVTGVKVTLGTNCIITFRATVKSTAAAGATIQNTANIAPSDAGAISGNPSSDPMVVHKDPILSVTNVENDADNIVTANQVVTYTITITNSGQGDANGVDLTGTISGPTGSVSSRTLTNCGSSSTYVDTSSGQSLSIAALAITTSNPCVISYTVTVNSGATSGSITNSVDITAAREGGNDPTAAAASTLLIGVVATPPNLSVAVSENDADDYVTPGQAVVYTIAITNSGQTDATTSLTSSVPGGMGTPGTRTYTNCGSPSSSFSSGTLTISSISVAAANTCTITFSEVVNSPQDEGNTLTLGADVAAASQGGNNPANVNATTLTVDATPVLNLTFTENDADNTVSRNQDVTYTATITNTGDGAATVVLFADSPAGAISSPSNFSLANCGSSYTNNSTSSVSVEGLTIQVGTPCVVSYHVTVNGDAEADSTITNSGDISAAAEGGNNPVPVSASTLTVASSPPNLSVANADNDADNIVTPSQDITYTVTITNDGGRTGTGISLNDPVSGAVGNVSTFNFSNCGSSYTNNSSSATVSITGLTVTTSTPCVITFHVSVNSNVSGGSSISSSADASAATEGGNNPSAVLSDSLTVATIPDLLVSVDSNDFDNAVTPGQVVTFSVTINNSGNGTAHTSGTVTIPNKVSSPSSISFNHCGSAGSSYSNPTLTLSSLTVTTADDCVISFTVTVNSPSTEGATFVVSSDIAAATEGGNNPDSVDSSVHTINVTPNLSTSTFAQSDANGSTLKPGETVNYTVTVKNTGDGAASGVSLNNSMPSNITFDPDSIDFGRVYPNVMELTKELV